MDLGIFRRSTGVFTAWIILPLLAVIGVDIGSAGFCFAMKRQLVTNKAALQAIDRLSQSCTAASNALTGAVKHDGALPAAEQEVSGWIDEIAPDTGFKIEKLSVSRSLGSDPSPISSKRATLRRTKPTAVVLPSIDVTLKGTGSYASLARFIHDLETGCSMLHVSGLRIQKEGYQPDGSYLCELIFRIYFLEA